MNWQAVINDYPRACRIIEKKLPAHLRSSYDAADFVSAALVALVANPEITYHGLNTLVLIAKRRMIEAARLPKILPLMPGQEPSDSAPTAHQELEAAELRDSLLAKCEKPKQRHALELLCQGYDGVEVASEIGSHRRQVQRFFRQFKLQHEPF